MTSGEVDFYLKPPDAEEIGSNDEWGPAYDRRENGKIYPVNSVLSVWLGNRDEDNLIYPLFLREQKAAWENYEDQIQDDDGDGQPEINREEEIRIALRTLETTLQGNQRFSRIKPVLVKSGNSYELDTNGQILAIPLQGTPLEGASQVGFSISHNTSATGAALGAQGCDDCHVSGTHFFQGARLIDLVGPEGEPVSQPNGMFFGCRYFAFVVNSIHQEIISPLFGPLIILVVFGIVLHYHSYGPRRITFDPYSQEVKRFSMIERGIHLFRLIAFVIMSITGLIMAFNLHLWQQLLFPSSQRMVDFHIWSGIVFVITTIGGILMWFRDALFASYDKEWVKKMGGYLGYKGHVPSGRFNAGQKMFYWYTAIFGVIISITGLMLIVKDWFQLSTVCLTSTVHNLMGFLIIAGVLAHAYLGTVANPGTWRVLVDGSVSRDWAKHHHPNWYRSLIKKGEIEDDSESPDDSPEMASDKESGKEDSQPE
jgi:formate dehydrogenase subunit gamma